MKPIKRKIKGIPYPQKKTKGDKEAPKKWSEAVTEQTKGLRKITKSCSMKITFFLPKNKYPKDFPYGPDLDNLLKRFFDALNKTIFSEAPGKDSCIVKLEVEKKKVEEKKEEKEKCGVGFELIELEDG